ncbi:hypothetical protein B1B_04594, partial [mine drainage metagenome]
KQGFLAKIWEVVGRIALEHVLGSPKGGPSTLEEDARLTALFLWAIQDSAEVPSDVGVGNDGEEKVEEAEESVGPGGYSLVYDVVRRFAQPLGIHLDAWEGRIIETTGGVVRLMQVSERIHQLFDEDESQKLFTHWEDSHRGRQTTLFSDQEPPVASLGATSRKPRRKAAEHSSRDL